MYVRFLRYLVLAVAVASLLQACGGGSVVYDPYSANYQRAGGVSSYSSWDSLNDRGGGSR